VVEETTLLITLSQGSRARTDVGVQCQDATGAASLDGRRGTSRGSSRAQQGGSYGGLVALLSAVLPGMACIVYL